MGTDKLSTAATDGSLFVSDIDSATCAFCAFGSGLAVGDRIKIYDEKTVFGRKTRERDVQVTAVKLFRSTARQITLDLKMITDEEATKIADDNDLTVQILLDHRAGNPNFDPKRPPVVVYFKPSD
ncbi:MAG TPA: hypothetical protein VGO35_04770 [Gammaproteobacteria bacterium]|nr:hypothetical protein [Gammaproteobacteria bacterium]